MKRLPLSASRLAFALALAGCGGGGTNPSADLAIFMGDYPPAPYGAAPGSTIANLTLAGKRDDNMSGSPTDDPVVDFKFGDYFKNKNLKALVILTAAEWCGPCKMEQPGLILAYDKYKASGQVAFIEAIVQNTAGMPADQTVADTWAKAYKIPFPIAGDPNRVLEPYYNVNAFPMQMVIRTRDMNIYWQNNGVTKDLEVTIDAVLAQ